MRFDFRLDAYRELGVSETASAEAIRQAYLRLARQYHPDHAPEGKQQEYEERMKRINSAYEILSDPQRRALYDRARRPHAPAPTTVRTTPHAQSMPRSAPRDPYSTMRAGYQQRYYRVQVNTQRMPPWARLLVGLFSGLGLVMGVVLGLPFGIIGCIPGALVGLIAGALVGLGAVYLTALLVPILVLGWLGQVVLGEAGLWGGVGLGALIGIGAVARLWKRANSGFRS